MYKIGSELRRAKLGNLRPTQMTVGFRAVDDKRRQLKKLSRKQLSSHMFPTVRGPGKSLYILDGHHAAVALLRDKVEDVEIGLVCDLSSLSESDFWTYLDHRSWMHCYDAKGRRRDFSDMPTRFDDLQDDPYRSLAAAVLAAGGFAKPDEPFYEFLWANHLRHQFGLSELGPDLFKRTVKKATVVAKSPESKFLPGWAGGS